MYKYLNINKHIGVSEQTLMMTPSVTHTLAELSLALNEMGLTSVSAEELFRRLQPMPRRHRGYPC